MTRRTTKFTVADISRVVSGVARACRKEGIDMVVEITSSGDILVRRDDRAKVEEQDTWADVG